MEREFAIFEIAGDIAHFRRQYAITTALTYVVPPRTALCGLVGAILGLSNRDNQYLEFFGDDHAVFGLQIINRVRTGHVSLNLLDTKGSPVFRPKAVNPHTTMRYEVIRCPRYRVIFAHPELSSELVATLRSGESRFTPCLGLAWMIAWFEGKPEMTTGELVVGDQTRRSFVSPVRVDDLQGAVNWHDGGLYQRLRMPAEMQTDRLVTRYEHYLVETTGLGIETSLVRYWRLADGSCFSPM